MSLFGAMMGDFDDDPFFGNHNRAMNQMNSMVSSFFSDPFGDVMGMSGMGFPGLMGAPPMMGQLMPRRQPQRGREQLMPFGFPPPMNGLFQAMDARQNVPNCHSFSSSTMVSMTTGPDGRPQVYQASSSTRTAPGGIRETKKSVADSRSGTKKLAIGHHIGERGHVIEREQNVYSGEQEERQELINLDEDSAESFNREWESRTRRAMGGVAIEDVTHRPASSHPRERPLLALTNGSSSSRSRVRANVQSPPVNASSSATSSHERPRKRDHGPDGASSSRRASKQQRGKRN